MSTLDDRDGEGPVSTLDDRDSEGPVSTRDDRDGEGPVSTRDGRDSEGPVSTLDGLDLPLPGKSSGKVRESWPLPDGRRVIVTTDRFSSFDRIIGSVPHKGQVVNRLAAWWFERVTDLIDHHLVSVPDPNVSITHDLTPLPVEVVVRGHITGSTSTSLWTMYADGARRLYGHTLPDGLAKHDPLPAPLVTPTTKAPDGGHDEPITAAEIVARGLVSAEVWEQIETIGLALFDRGVKLAAEAGFVLADTKYELGTDPDGNIVLIDEVHTPDSSRFWVADTLEERLSDGAEPESLDKEPVRLALRAAGFVGDGPIPDLGRDVWGVASARYVRLFESLTGSGVEPCDGLISDRIVQNLTDAGVLP